MIYSYRQNFTPSTMYSSNYGEQLLYTYFTLYNNINNKNVLTNVLYADIVPISDKLLQTVQSNPQAILSKMTEKCSDSMYNSYENILLTDKITNNELFVEKLKDYDSNAELIKEAILDEFGISKADADKINDREFIGNLFLIIIIKAIVDKKPDQYIKYCIYNYLEVFNAQLFNNGICDILSSIFIKNALTRINHARIHNILEFRTYYMNQFKHLITDDSLIKLNEYLQHLEKSIIREHNKLLSNNPFYQMLFNMYDENILDINSKPDKYEATLYFLKRNHALNKFIINQFSKMPTKVIEKRYGEACGFFKENGTSAPFRLNEELFKQFYNLFDEDIKNKYNDKRNDYESYEYKYNIYHSYCVKKIIEWLGKHNNYKVQTYNDMTSLHTILSNYIEIKYREEEEKNDEEDENENNNENEEEANDEEDENENNYNENNNNEDSDTIYIFTLSYNRIDIEIEEALIDGMRQCIKDVYKDNKINENYIGDEKKLRVML